MMLQQTMMWTPLPAGWDETDSSMPLLRVSVLLTPKLTWTTTDSKVLGDFPDFKAGAWATLVTGGISFGGLGFAVTLSGTTLDGAAVRRVSADPSRDLFATMLPSSTEVLRWVDDDFSDLGFRSFPMEGWNTILQIFQKNVPATTRPDVTSLYASGRGLLAPVSVNGYDKTNWSGVDAADLARQGYTEVPDVTTDAGKAHATAQLRDFLSPTRTAEQLRNPLVWKAREFHETVSLFGSHPNLLRALGLLIDLEVDPSSVTLPVGNQVLLTVAPTYAGGAGVARADVVATVVTTLQESPAGSRVFELTPRTASVTSDGVADMSAYTAVTSEVENEAMAHVNLGSNLQQAELIGLDNANSPEQLGLPARRSAGIAVTYTGMAQKFREAMERARMLQQSIPSRVTPLFAEDLAQGYRLDVRKGAGDWRSLHRRRGTLVPEPGSGLGEVDLGVDEGWSELSFTDDTSSTVRRVPETNVRWMGWSLSIARPGQFLAEDGTLTGPPSALPEGVHGNLTYSAPLPGEGGAHLPVLRFGGRYDLRMRLTDPAGRSREPGPSASTLSVVYRRHEPIPSGEIYHLGKATVGEQPDILVVRSEGGGAAVAAGSAIAQRILLPPRGSVWLAEQHGQLDDASGAPRADLYSELVTRDAAVFDATTFAPSTFDPLTCAVPLLIDPAVRGVTVRGGPVAGNGFNGSVTALFDVSWPSAHAIELRAVPSSSQSTKSSAGVITATIAPGRVAHLQVSSTMGVGALSKFEIWALRGSPADEAAAAGGTWWQLTPDRLVRVIHATRRPVSPPRFRTSDTWTVTRPLGETAAQLAGSITADRPSTQNLALLGDLTSGVDDGPGAAPPRIVVTSAGELADVQVPDPAPGGSEGPVSASVRIPLPDTTCRLLSLSAVATSRFADYFRVTREIPMSSPTATLDAGGAKGPVVAGSVKVTWVDPAGAEVAGKEGADFSVDAEQGMITILRPELLPGTFTVTWIPQSITLPSRGAATASERSRSVTLPATTRPDAVSVAWVLPAFRWNAPERPTVLTPTRTSKREGGMLRVYLNRPWWSAGLGEQLAVVVSNGRTPDDDPLSDQVTRWGQDPATKTKGLPRAWPQVTTFVNRSSDVTGVLLPDLPAKKANVALYTIGTGSPGGPVSGFDSRRDLWWVDLELDQGIAYRPFIRLALARYQPNADPSIRLSPISMLDVVQLEPDRTATVTVPRPVPGTATTVKATVTLVGPSYEGSASGNGPGPATLILETNAVADPTNSRADWTESARVSMASAISGGIATWKASISVPANRPVGRYRLVVEQLERWRSDGTTASNTNVVSARFGNRLVHQDVLPI